MTLIQQVREDIAKTKAALIRKWARNGPYENFGQKEVRALQNKYAKQIFDGDYIWNVIIDFDDWCMNYTGQ